MIHGVIAAAVRVIAVGTAAASKRLFILQSDAKFLL